MGQYCHFRSSFELVTSHHSFYAQPNPLSLESENESQLAALKKKDPMPLDSSEERSRAFNSESPPTAQRLLNAEGSDSTALNKLYLHFYLNMYL